MRELANEEWQRDTGSLRKSAYATHGSGQLVESLDILCKGNSKSRWITNLDNTHTLSHSHFKVEIMVEPNGGLQKKKKEKQMRRREKIDADKED